jgi:hypothetical protein
MILADEINMNSFDENELISLDDLLDLYEKIISKNKGYLSNYIKYAFYILFENNINNNDVLNKLFDFLFKNMKKSNNGNSDILNLFLYQIREYINKENKENFMTDIRVKKITMYMLIKSIEDKSSYRMALNLVNSIFNKKDSDLEHNFFLKAFKNLCLKVYKRLEEKNKSDMLIAIKGELKK